MKVQGRRDVLASEDYAGSAGDGAGGGGGGARGAAGRRQHEGYGMMEVG
ncbi:MAG: hypothetical protein ACON4Z_11150 [Planctomycetota bacterium]